MSTNPIRFPAEPPGKVIDLKVTDSTYTTLCLSWSKPHEEEGVEDEAKGYFVEIRPAENPEWLRCTTNAIIMTSFTIKHLKSMAMYWVRVTAANEGGEGQPQELDNYILAMPPPGEYNGNSSCYNRSSKVLVITLQFTQDLKSKESPVLLCLFPSEAKIYRCENEQFCGGESWTLCTGQHQLWGKKQEEHNVWFTLRHESLTICTQNSVVCLLTEKV